MGDESNPIPFPALTQAQRLHIDRLTCFGPLRVRHQGHPVVIDHVPAEVCTVCGDVLLTPGTVRGIEALLQAGRQPTGTVPLYEFAST